MENNEIMTNEVIEEVADVVEETSKKINPATGIIAGLAIVGTYYVVTNVVEYSKKLVKGIKSYKKSKEDYSTNLDDLDDVCDEACYEEI